MTREMMTRKMMTQDDDHARRSWRDKDGYVLPVESIGGLEGCGVLLRIHCFRTDGERREIYNHSDNAQFVGVTMYPVP
jgi:hypothetical protein